MLVDLIKKFSSIKEGELFVIVGEPETILKKIGPRKAMNVKFNLEKKMFASDECLTVSDSKKYYGQ